MRGKLDGRGEQASVQTEGSDEEEGGVQLESVKGEERKTQPASAHRQGMEKAAFRERVRRAGRRTVAFGAPEGCHEGLRFECVQHGKPTESSFAKGEWAVRVVD